MDEFKGGGISGLVMVSSLSHCDPYWTWTASPGCAYRGAGKKTHAILELFVLWPS